MQRGPVVGRKNYYDSGAVWAGRLAALMFSVLPTLMLRKINPRLWLTAYLEACATVGGKAPPNVASYLPWNVAADRRQEWGWREEEEVTTDTS
jgi:hypothetical protein